MKPLLIDDNDIDVDELNFDVDFNKVLIKEIIKHWSGNIIQYADDLAVGCL